jgi:hypothetical protein
MGPSLSLKALSIQQLAFSQIEQLANSNWPDLDLLSADFDDESDVRIHWGAAKSLLLLSLANCCVFLKPFWRRH